MDLPMHVSSALDEEYRKLHKADPPPDFPSALLTTEQILDPERILAELRSGGKLARYVGDLIPRETLQTISGSDQIAAALNELISGRSIYSRKIFQHHLPKTLITAAEMFLKCTVEQQQYINRLVLEFTFPDMTARIDDVRMLAITRALRSKNAMALCFSGGGIRSATINLGVLQGLAKLKLIRRFDYLSTVSGGGYIGGWLSALIHRFGSCAKIEEELVKLRAGGFNPEWKPIRHLRNYSNYLTPKLGVASADTWTFVGTYLRNVFLNWLMLIPLLVAVLGLPRLFHHALRIHSTVATFAALTIGVLGCVAGIAYMGLERPSNNQALFKHWPRLFAHRDQGSFLQFCLLPLVTGALAFSLAWAWGGSGLARGHVGSTMLWFMFGGAGLHALAGLAYSSILRRFLWTEFAVLIVTGGVGGLLLGGLGVFAFPRLISGDVTYIYSAFAVPLFLATFLLPATLFVGLSSNWTDDSDREWWARAGSWILAVVVVWSLISLTVFFGIRIVALAPRISAAIGAVSGFVSTWLARSGATPAKGDGNEAAAMRFDLAARTAGIVFIAALLITVGIASSVTIVSVVRAVQALAPVGPGPLLEVLQDAHSASLNSMGRWTVALIVVSVLVGAVMGSFININKFSMHGLYRNRLIRAYLGASRWKRHPNPFTGFDEEDNLQMASLWPNQNTSGPFHVVNIALNIVRGQELAWQERKAESFVVTPLHAGGISTGFRKLENIEDGKIRRYGGDEGISLGTAVTISGAAASPNMGYHSSPVLAFIMTFFNVRLGWWLGNPGMAGNNTYFQNSPRFAIRRMTEEALGLATNQTPYIYLSDGGHFENLGLYQMVLRRCAVIVVIDASQDPNHTFVDLGNALRKIRIDLGVSIDFEAPQIYSRASKKFGAYCAIGKIRYQSADARTDDGTIVYLKPAYYGSEPRDVCDYAEQHPAFPHESTADQWFSESQFESYRALGEFILGESLPALKTVLPFVDEQES